MQKILLFSLFILVSIFAVNETFAGGGGGGGGGSPSSDSSGGCRNCNTPTLNDKIFVSLNSEQMILMNDNSNDVLYVKVGDELKIMFSTHDDRGANDIRRAGLYTNYDKRPNDMNLYYANNFNDAKQISLTFYEWNKFKDDESFDYSQSVFFETPEILTKDNFTITFQMHWKKPIPESEIRVKIVDSGRNYFINTLPFKIQVIPENSINPQIIIFQEDEYFENIPSWIKNIFGGYDEKIVSEHELLNAIRFLMNEKVLSVNEI